MKLRLITIFLFDSSIVEKLFSRHDQVDLANLGPQLGQSKLVIIAVLVLIDDNCFMGLLKNLISEQFLSLD